MSRAWPATNWFMGALFIFSAVVQLNDPDPWVWLSIYLAAAGISFAEARRRAGWYLPAVAAAMAIIWAATIAPRVLGKVGFLDMFGAWEMKNLGIEEEREMYGLLIVGVWMTTIAVVAWRRRRPLVRAAGAAS